MPLVLRWQTREISLHQGRAEGFPGTDPEVGSPLETVALDFDLSPLTLTSDDDRPRLVDALRTLKEQSAPSETAVHLLVPSIWGVALHVPGPNLRPEELAEHLHWELSKALLDPVDQYAYSYAREKDCSIRLVALRSRLLDLIRQVVSESGFQLCGVFLDVDRFAHVNLLETVFQSAVSPPPAPSPTPPPPPEFRPPIEEPVFRREKPRGAQPPWFLAGVIIAGVLLVVMFGWMKLTGERKPRPVPQPSPPLSQTKPEPTPADTLRAAQTQQDTARRDTALAHVEPAPAQLAQPLKPAAFPCVQMSQRMAALQKLLEDDFRIQKFELISFSGERFLVQPVIRNAAELETASSQISTLPQLTEVKSQHSISYGNVTKGSISGKLTPDPTLAAPGQASADSLMSLAKKHGLKHPPAGGLIFTGKRADVLSFLNEVAAQNGAIYRLILMPWGTELYRTVLEI